MGNSVIFGWDIRAFGGDPSPEETSLNSMTDDTVYPKELGISNLENGYADILARIDFGQRASDRDVAVSYGHMQTPTVAYPSRTISLCFSSLF